MTTTTTNSPVICSKCGAECKAEHGFAAGYATYQNGDKLCYDCAAQNEQEYMIKEGATVLYLTHDNAGKWQVGNWTGRLTFPVIWWQNSQHSCFGGYVQRTDAWFVGPDGAIWHAKNIGDMDLVRCRRTKKQGMYGRGGTCYRSTYTMSSEPKA